MDWGKPSDYENGVLEWSPRMESSNVIQIAFNHFIIKMPSTPTLSALLGTADKGSQEGSKEASPETHQSGNKLAMTETEATAASANG